MISSGTTAKATTSADAIELLPAGHTKREITIVNEGAAAGFVSLDGGTTWKRMPAGPASRTFDIRHGPVLSAVKAKRDGATDMSGLYADAI